jgi:hypothetical protein
VSLLPKVAFQISENCDTNIGFAPILVQSLITITPDETPVGLATFSPLNAKRSAIQADVTSPDGERPAKATRTVG